MRLIIDNVSKTYRSGVRALHNFSLELGPGVLGLCGPNGAGKSTLMSILATITQPSGGRVAWEGDDGSSFDILQHPNALRQLLGYLPQEFGFYPKLSAIEFLQYLAAVKGIPSRAAKPRIQHLLEVVNLVEAAKRPLGSFSGGMRQRVGIAQALLNDPELLIVDEPTAGLDPEERVRFRNLIAELAADRIVILSTHIVSDVESTANQIALLNHGDLVTHTTPEELLLAVEGRVWECVVSVRRLPALQAASLRQWGRTARRWLSRARRLRTQAVGERPAADSAVGRCLSLQPERRRRGLRMTMATRTYMSSGRSRSPISASAPAAILF